MADTILQLIKSVSNLIVKCTCAVIPPLCEATLSLLRQEAVCQQTGDTDSEGDEDDIEHDELLIDAVTDLLPAMGACMGSAFAPLFHQFYEPLMKFSVGYCPKSSVFLFDIRKSGHIK